MPELFKDKRVLVTGGAGFIGCNFVRRLIKEGAQVRIFDNFTTGKLQDIVVSAVSSPVTTSLGNQTYYPNHRVCILRLIVFPLIHCCNSILVNTTVEVQSSAGI